MGVVLLNGADASGFDRVWCVKIRLAQGEADDVTASGLEFPCLAAHGDGGRFAQTTEQL